MGGVEGAELAGDLLLQTLRAVQQDVSPQPLLTRLLRLQQSARVEELRAQRRMLMRMQVSMKVRMQVKARMQVRMKVRMQVSIKVRIVVRMPMRMQVSMFY